MLVFEFLFNHRPNNFQNKRKKKKKKGRETWVVIYQDGRRGFYKANYDERDPSRWNQICTDRQTEGDLGGSLYRGEKES